MDITFRMMATRDFANIYKWANAPHVIKWYGKKPLSLYDVYFHYGEDLIEDGPTTKYIIIIDGVDVGQIQTYIYSDYPDDIYSQTIENGEKAAGVDLYIGHEDYIHKGYGTHIMRKFISDYVFTNPRAEMIIICPEPANAVAIRIYEKTGFRWYKTIDCPNGEQEYLMVLYKSDWRNENV